MSSLRARAEQLDSSVAASSPVRPRKRRAEAEEEGKAEQPLSEPEDAEPVGKGRARNYCFTVNKEPLRFYNHWETCDLGSLIQYIVFQKEVAPETGHLHVQGYVQLTKALTFKQVQKLLRSRCHLEPAKGTPAQNKAYCTKVESRLDGTDPVERGHVKEQGRRTDLEAIAERVVADGSVHLSLIQEKPAVYVRHFRGLQALENALNSPRPRGAPRVVFMHGPPGCGKSRLAHLMWPHAFSATDCKEGWMDGYKHESVIIFDDFVGASPNWSMLRLLDYNPLQLPVKGGFVPIAARTFIFTSNLHPSNCYPGNEAWMRRINQFGEIWDEEVVKRKLASLLDAECARIVHEMEPPKLTRSLGMSERELIDLTKEVACAHGNQEDSCAACGEK